MPHCYASSSRLKEFTPSFLANAEANWSLQDLLGDSLPRVDDLLPSQSARDHDNERTTKPMKVEQVDMTGMVKDDLYKWRQTQVNPRTI